MRLGRPATAPLVDHRHGLSLQRGRAITDSRRAGDRVKTNRRDAIGLAKLLRAGELTPVWVTDEGHEAIRNLVRARTAAVETQRVHRQQVSAFMLKHGRVFPWKETWSMRYVRWLQEQRFDHPAHQIALQELVDAVRASRERIVRIEAAIKGYLPSWSLAPVVHALQALRGVELIVAVTFAIEIGDIRRFDSPRQLTGYLGLVQANARPVIRSSAAGSRKPATDGSATCWS
jgi:transposase